ncbi:ester cyclase [Nocardia sp. CA-119907]|uniref:ester cyclase n=1 Tax=Nocardia sp. CA-119907 TaxID=3239973 RepID=UPI003D965DAD
MTSLEKIEYFDDRYRKARAELGGALPGADRIGEFMSHWYTAVNSADIDAQLAMCTEDILVEDPAMFGRFSKGHADFRRFAEITYTAFPDMRFEATAAPLIALDGNRIVVPWHGTGTLTGGISGWPPEHPEPPVAATGRRFDLEGMDTYEFRDGLISFWRISYDNFEMSQQLGLMP